MSYNILPKIGNMILVDDFFIMLAFFYSLREHSFSKQFLEKINKSFVTEEAHNFIVRIDISCVQEPYLDPAI